LIITEEEHFTGQTHLPVYTYDALTLLDGHHKQHIACEIILILDSNFPQKSNSVTRGPGLMMATIGKYM